MQISLVLALIDEIRIALNPTIPGKGKSLFDDIDKRDNLELIDAKPL